MTDLVPLDPEPLGVDVIKTLEAVLEMARDGRVSSVAIAVVYRDGTSDGSWSTAPSSIRLVGAIDRLGYRFNRSIDRD